MVKIIAALSLLTLAGCTNNQPCSVVERDHPGGQLLTGEGMPARGIELTSGLHMSLDERRKHGLQDITYCELQ